MAIQSGAAARMFVHTLDASGVVGMLTGLTMEQSQQNITTLQDEAMARQNVIRSGSISYTAFFDDDSDSGDGPHDKLNNMDTTARVVAYHHRATRGASAFALTALRTQHSWSVSNGELVVPMTAVASTSGVEGGHTLTTGLETFSGAGNSTGVDDGAGAATDFGLQAFLNVTDFTGTSATITIQDSDDDGSGDAYAAVTGAAFTAVTGATSERIATGRTENVKEWLRLNIAGTFSDLKCSVVVVRNTTSVLFA